MLPAHLSRRILDWENMGAWGDGLIDNDSAMDFIGVFAAEFEDDIVNIGDESSIKNAGKLCAAVGVLLRLSTNSFDPIPGIDPKSHFYPHLIKAISNNLEHTLNFPGNAGRILASILQGNGEELAQRRKSLDANISDCLFEEQLRDSQFPFSILETDLFTSDAAKQYMAEKTNALISQFDSTLTDKVEVINMSYSFLGGMLALFLILPICKTDISIFESWRDTCRSIWNENGSEDLADDLDFELGYRKNVSDAFECAIQIHQNVV